MGPNEIAKLVIEGTSPTFERLSKRIEVTARRSTLLEERISKLELQLQELRTLHAASDLHAASALQGVPNGTPSPVPENE